VVAKRSKRTIFTQVLDRSLEMRGSNPGSAISCTCTYMVAAVRAAAATLCILYIYMSELCALLCAFRSCIYGIRI
jgi:hypothetical protein